MNGNHAVWGWVGSSRGEVFVYDIAAGTTTRIARPRGIRNHFDPALAVDGTFYFGRHRSDCGNLVRLMRRRPGEAPTVVARLPGGFTLGYP